MKLIRIMSKLMNEPWCILPSQHAVLVDAVQKHLDAGRQEVRAEDDPLLDMIAKEPTPLLERRGNLAIVRLEGIMGQHLSALDMACGGADVGRVGEALDEALADPAIMGVALFIDSPGGLLTGVPELAAKVRAATAVKPVVAYTDSEMCSAAMWVAAGADEIYATESATVGSIGVYRAMLDTSRAYEMAGVKRERIRSGKFKAAGMDGISLSEEERADIQASVDSIAGRLKDWIKACRPGVAEETMQGQCFYGWQAMDAGLIDGVKGEAEVLAHLGRLVELTK